MRQYVKPHLTVIGFVDSRKTIGLQMQRARQDAGMEQDEAANALRIHPVTLSRYETGKRPIPEQVMDAMRALYGMTAQATAAVNQEADPRVWHGEMRATLRTLTAMKKAAGALAEMAEAAEQSVRGLVESEVLLSGPSASPPITKAQIYEDVERLRAARVARDAAPAASPPPPERQTNGTTG